MNDKTFYILLGGAEHHRFFTNNADYSDQQWFWTVPKTARRGDLALVYLCAPVSAIVGSVEITAEPFYNVDMFPAWKDNWMAEIGRVRYARSRPELGIKGLRELFPDWGWLRYPRGKARIPAEIVPALLKLINRSPPA